MTGAGTDHAPAPVMPSTRMVVSVPKRNPRSSAGARFMNMSCSLPATVTALTGSALSPFSIQDPVAPKYLDVSHFFRIYAFKG